MFNPKENTFPQNLKILKVLLLRCLIGGTGALFFYLGMRRVPISIASIFPNMKGIFILLFSMLFLQDNINLKSILSIIICFLGAVLIVKPSIILSSKDDNSLSFSKPAYLTGCFFLVITCLAKSTINIVIRKYGIYF